MNIGVPKERRPFEFRIGLSPAGVQMLSTQSHVIYVEHDAGLGAGFSDQDFEAAGARIVYSPREVFGRADLLVKVARPLLEEIQWLRPGTAIAGLLHLSSSRQDKIDSLLQNQITAIAYEEIALEDGRRPVLRPLSEIGGRLAAQIGARLLQNNSGGKGILLGGIAGVPPAEVVVLGAGVVGSCAARAFMEMGAHVTVIDSNLAALQRLYDQSCSLVTMVSNPVNISRSICYADIVVGAIRTPGERVPVVVTREMVRSMKPRSVIMDISIDEGGCVETSRPTTHEHSTYLDEGVVHYCVPNIPSVVARTSTYAFLNSAFPYIEAMANQGVDTAIKEDPALQKAVNTQAGKVVHLSRMTVAALRE
jgi:alanine dehydrogenase